MLELKLTQVLRCLFIFGLMCFITVSTNAASAFSWQPTPGGRTASLEVTGPAKVGFTLMNGEQTGIRFTNTLDDRLVMQNNNFMQGSGVALGDFDGDGWCDVYLCAIDGTNALFRNLGDWRFENVTTRAGVGAAAWHSTGAIFADIDADGNLDLLVNSLGQGTHCFRNVGNGRFQDVTSEAGVKSQTGSTSLALADIDGDGDLDLYVANYGTMAILRGGGRADVRQINGQLQIVGPYAGRLRFVDGQLEEVGEPDVLYLNDGHGHFKAVPWNSEWFLDEQGKPMPAPWDYGLSVQIRDANEDGFPDIYVCNDFQTVDRFWINDGKGHFRLLARLATRQQSFASMGVDFADIDRDGRLDFFVVEMLSREHSRRMRQVGAMKPSYPMPGRFENRPEVNHNTLFWNRGDGTYAEIAGFSGVDATEWSWQPVFLDVDLDGFEDLLVVNGHAFDVQDRDALAQVRALGRQTPEQTRTNLLLYPRLLTPNFAFRNRGDLTFEEVGHAWGFDSRQISHGIALADLDHDGDLDVVVNCLYSRALLYRNDSTTPRVAVRLRGKAPNVQGIGAKIKLSGGAVPLQSQEIVSGGRYLSGDDAMRVFAAGVSTNTMRVEINWRSGVVSSIPKILANHVYEIDEPGWSRVTPSRDQPAETLFHDVSELLNHTHHEELFNDYARQPLLSKQLSQLGPGVAWFDVNGDGHDDLFIGSGRGGELAAYLGDGRGGFSRISGNSTALLPDDLTGLAGWTGSDGRRALLGGVATYETSNAVSVLGWELVRTNQLTTAPVRDITPNESSVGPLAVTDYDGDGDLDIFIGGRFLPGMYPQAATSRLFQQQSNRLSIDETNQRVLQNVGLVSGVVWSDLSGDGYPELILACEWGPIKVFRNEHGKLTLWDAPITLHASRFTFSALTGWWNSVKTADIDGDGRLDIIAGNWGLNSPYHATSAQPARLYYGDFGGRGVMDLIEASYAPELGATVPRRSLSALSQAVPALAQLFRTHQAFSTVLANELFQRLNVRPAEVQAATFESMVFFNRGDHFQAEPLPAQAQWTPIFGITTADFDGDGRQDLFLAQNFFALRPELARLDAGRGLLLRGIGGGKLEPISGQVSGIAVYGEQRGAAVSDFNEDGRMDLVVTQNGAATRLFQNASGAPGLRMRLQGPPGNPQGIGSIVRLQFENASSPAQEVQAGSGYWSQDTALLIFGIPTEPRSLSVLWPGGKTTATNLPPSAREIAVTYPR